MDHTHCFDGPGYLDARLDRIDFVQDEQVYGLFPEFKPYIQPDRPNLTAALAKLKTLDRAWVQGVVAGIPGEWEVDAAARAALANLVYSRANFLSDNFVRELEAKLLT